MSFTKNSKNGLQWISADNITAAGAKSAFTTRCGGISDGFLASLNLSYSRGDDPGRVKENFKLLARAVGYDPARLVASRQVHGDVIRVASEEDCGKLDNFTLDYDCDAIITNIKALPLMVFSADCVPILLYDPVCCAIGAVHSGWRGTALGIVKKTVLKMGEQFGCKASDLVAAIGPCIGACCFETDADVPESMEAALPSGAAAQLLKKKGLKYSVDLKGINRYMLESAGVENISVSEQCTACDTDMFWSHRAQGDKRGSMASVIVLE